MYKILLVGIYMYKTNKYKMNTASTRITETDRDQATQNQFGYVNTRTGQFEAVELKEHLRMLGIYKEQEETKDLSKELQDYYKRLKQIVNSL